MALTRKRVESIKTKLTIVGQGETVTFDVEFNNVKTSELQAMTEGTDWNVTDVILKLVREWDCEYPLTQEGLRELEDDRPGILMGVITGFHEARRVERAKN